MGYYTKHRLESYNKEFEEALPDFTDNLLAQYLFADDYYEGKWYDMDTELTSLAKAHPDAEAHFTCVGEEHPDVWCAYVSNGKYLRGDAKLVYPTLGELQGGS